MRVYSVSKNTGPSWRQESSYLVYLGTSLVDANAAVGSFTKYMKNHDQFPTRFSKAYSALPPAMEREMIQFFSADGWWFSIEMFDL